MDRLLIIDTETGGIDPSHYSILSLGAVVWEPYCIIAEKELFVAEPEIVTEAEAITVNGIDVGHIRSVGLSPIAAVERFEEFVTEYFPRFLDGDRVPLAGHNVSFDVEFLKRLYRLAGRDYRQVYSHRVLDTASILRFLTLAGKLDLASAGSDEAFQRLGIAMPAAARHSALGDARATAILLDRLLQIVRSNGNPGIS